MIARNKNEVIQQNPKLDLYHVLRLPDEDLILDYEEFKENYKRIEKNLNDLLTINIRVVKP